MIVIGGGPIQAKDSLSVAAFQRLKQSKNVVFQSEKQALTAQIEAFETLDELFEQAQDFEQLYEQISAFLQSKGSDVVFVAIGDGINNHITQRLVQDWGQERVEIFPGPLNSHLVSEQLGGALTMVSGDQAAEFAFDTDIPTLIYEVDSEVLLEELRLRLQKYYGDRGQLWQNGKRTSLLELKKTVPCDLFVPSVAICQKSCYTYKNLETIVKTLRKECPWDKEQDHKSIRVNLVEECFELLEAIDKQNVEEMIEEMGDVLLQVALHNQMETETGEVDIDEVTTGICRKMIRRHPHVYGQVEADSSEEVKTNWEAIKKQEYGFTSQTQALQHVSGHLPSMIRANKLLKKAEKYGYHSGEDIYALFDRFMQNSGNDKEDGKFLLAVVDAFRRRKKDAFMVLNDANNEFIVDFKAFEAENS